ncbi:fibrinogen-binding protein [Rhizobium leguminosarum]|uniref:Fibrinogen-binding protein n=1 Tax=Rhizobium leguminosarum TaxID=384 RepID=A0A4V2IJP5_RHILE|nr:fibrinogen-binding protein [Rhizobium leguminosarum]TAU85982.1 fibrinogen-binding protein [Rhizobium leguminosarum]TAU91116.1 fibrinogen-binding protein [Rhizobium leguminosarum]TAV55761.1 fibrinogen-binding protein [Rhizobium leguminosarum]TAX12158.1 fibrinogen-binding protein [Rhizobium leguminosarum]TAX74296.1 fibrinogen-binding protein [Rhizobium leguminosarum]
MSDETEITKVGALADGFANSAINSTEIEDDSTGYVGGVANGDNRDNTDNSVDVDVKAEIDVAANNGNNRDNEYDWSYKSDDDTSTKTTTITDSNNDYDWSYDSKSYSDNDTDTKTITDTDTKTVTDTDIKTVTETDTDTKTVSDSNNTSDSFNKTDTDFAVIEDVKDSNLGVAGHDLTFNLGDDFSFTLDVDSILNNSLTGEGNDSGFSAIQANHLADQDNAWNTTMNNQHADNHLKADGGDASSAEGMEMDGKGWDLKAGDDATGSSAADASAILANSGFHLELVQGANLLSNTVDSSVIGGNSHASDVGEDTST